MFSEGRGKVMNIHFLPDSIYSQQFIDFLTIHGLSDKNDFYIISNNELKYISSEIKIISGNKLSILRQILKIVRLKANNQIFVHFLSDLHLFPLLFTRKNVKKYWIYWGADLYSFINYQLYDSETLKYLNINSKNKRTLKNVVFSLLRKKVIAKLDYVAINESEYPILIKNFRTKAVPINLAYSSEEKKFNEYKKDSCNEELTILLGNSGDPTNNHITILEKLARIGKPFKVIVPLSYGSNKNYIEKVVETGKELLADKFIPILDFMSPEKYIELLSSVDVAIMNHYRQQAVGNIRILINLRKTVYLRPENPLFLFYKKKGLFLKNIEEMNEDDLFNKIDDEKISGNLKIIDELYSNKNVLANWKNYL